MGKFSGPSVIPGAKPKLPTEPAGTFDNIDFSSLQETVEQPETPAVGSTY